MTRLERLAASYLRDRKWIVVRPDLAPGHSCIDGDGECWLSVVRASITRTGRMPMTFGEWSERKIHE